MAIVAFALVIFLCEYYLLIPVCHGALYISYIALFCIYSVGLKTYFGSFNKKYQSKLAIFRLFFIFLHVNINNEVSDALFHSLSK